MDPKQAIEFIKGLKFFFGKGSPGASKGFQMIKSNTFEQIGESMVEIARKTIESNQSEGPPLSQKWVRQKQGFWRGQTWFVGATNNRRMGIEQGMTYKGFKRPFSRMSPSTKNVFTGELDDLLTFFGDEFSSPLEVRVGYQDEGHVHPVSGTPMIVIAWKNHVGKNARPFLNARESLRQYRKEAKKILIQAIKDMAESV